MTNKPKSKFLQKLFCTNLQTIFTWFFLSINNRNILLTVLFIPFSGKGQFHRYKAALKIVHHVDVAIKSYVISILTGSTFDGFIDYTNFKQKSGTLLMKGSFYKTWKLIAMKLHNCNSSYNSALWLKASEIEPRAWKLHASFEDDCER